MSPNSINFEFVPVSADGSVELNRGDAADANVDAAGRQDAVAYKYVRYYCKDAPAASTDY